MSIPVTTVFARADRAPERVVGPRREHRWGQQVAPGDTRRGSAAR